MAPPAWVAEVNRLLHAGGPPNLIFDNILDVLLARGMAVKLVMRPDELLPHPKNRGGRMVVASEVEHKGALILKQEVL